MKSRLTPFAAVTLGLRVLMEAGIVFGLAYWGVHAGDSTAGRIALGILAPVLGFGLWGAVDFHQAGRFAEPLRLVQELVISGLAALALYAAGLHVVGVSLAALSVVYHALVYLSGGALLNRPKAAV
jgi:Protein of unknown function (DUF2568)